jgi:outer membrane protein assembly factor BamA
VKLVGFLALAAGALCSACGGTATTARPAALPAPSRAACPDRAPQARADAGVGGLASARVGQVCLVGGSDRLRATAGFAVRTKAGEPLDLAKAHDALRDLLRLPEVEDAEAYGRREPDGTVTVIYALTEFPTVADVALDGFHSLQRERLERIPLAKGDRYRPWLGRQITGTLQQAYTDQGYCSAKVSFAVTPAGPTAVHVRFTADEHSLCRVGAITFHGNAKVSAADLTRASGLAQGGTWNEAVFERAQLLVEALLWNRGLIESWVDAKHGDVAADGTIPLTFDVHEGDVFTLRKITIRGVRAALERELHAKLKSKTRRVFVRDTIQADVAAIRDAVRSKNPGKDVGVVPVTHVDKKAKSIDVVIQVTLS